MLSQAECHACVDACPTQAWILDDNILGLNIEQCDGCGLCVANCPTGALHVPYPWIIRALGGRKIALFACDKSNRLHNGEPSPCIHSLGLRQLLVLSNFGIEYLLISTGECTDCHRNTGYGLEQQIDEVNKLLAERCKPLLKILRRSTRVWNKIYKTDELISHGTLLPRRDFLRGGGRLLRHQLAVLNPLNLPEYQTLPPAQLLGDTLPQGAHWPHAPALDYNRCNGCDACANLCPTDALKLLRDDNHVINGYRIDPAFCTGCGICETVCNSDAITVSDESVATVGNVDLTEYKCHACGNPFHQPKRSKLPAASLCPVCSHRNHSSNLFQILTDE